MRNVDDPSEQVVITEWSDVQTAKAWASSPVLREAFARGGVIGTPDVVFLEEIDRHPA